MSPWIPACALLCLGAAIQTATSAATETPPPLSDPALEAALLYDGDGEWVAIRHSIGQELDTGMPGAEQVVLWTMLGPTYWASFVSVLSRHAGQWQSLARVNLKGAEAGLMSVGADDIIVLDAKLPGPNDPVCCPSQPKKLKYRYSKGKLLDVTPNVQPNQP